MMEISYRKDPNKLTNYPTSREERENMKGRRTFKKERRREYKDLDEPEGGQTERNITKPLVNFLDI